MWIDGPGNAENELSTIAPSRYWSCDEWDISCLWRESTPIIPPIACKYTQLTPTFTGCRLSCVNSTPPHHDASALDVRLVFLTLKRTKKVLWGYEHRMCEVLATLHFISFNSQLHPPTCSSSGWLNQSRFGKSLPGVMQRNQNTDIHVTVTVHILQISHTLKGLGNACVVATGYQERAEYKDGGNMTQVWNLWEEY